MDRESFIIHTEYIDDLPEEYKGAYLMYIFNYGCHGIEPDLVGLELSIWLKIKRRMDADLLKYENKTNKLALCNERRHLESKIKNCKSEDEKKIYLEELEKINSLLNDGANTEPYGSHTAPYGTHTGRVIDNDNLFDTVSLIYNDNVNEALTGEALSAELADDPTTESGAKTAEELNNNINSNFLDTNINKWFDNNAPKVKPKARINVGLRLKTNGLTTDYLDYALSYANSKATNETQKTAYLVKAVLDWQDLLKDYKNIINNKIQADGPAPKIKKLTIPPPTNCTSCGAGLVYDYGTNSYYCRTCHITQELKNGKWQAAV